MMFCEKCSMKKLLSPLLILVVSITIAFVSCGGREIKVPSPGELAKVIEDDYNQVITDAIIERGGDGAGWVEKVELTRTNDSFPYEYEGEIYIVNSNNPANVFTYTQEVTAIYSGTALKYYYGEPSVDEEDWWAEPERKNRVVEFKSKNDLRVKTNPIQKAPDTETIITDTTPKGAECITLTYRGEEFDLYRFNLSSNALKFLKEQYGDDEENLIAKNIYIPEVAYDAYVKDILALSESFDSLDIFNSMDINYFQQSRNQGILQIFELLSVDSFPERIYPINDKNAEQRFLSDLAVSLFVIDLIDKTERFYFDLSEGEASWRIQRMRRLSANLNSSNKALFKAIFPQLTSSKSVGFKGFYTEE